ncbi:MAG TPA: DUF3341 domain-containing protein [Verrucomicrobiota bacterium]|nr:DUF3341 domain-containing protein [Verrucomicrobiota bacterium]
MTTESNNTNSVGCGAGEYGLIAEFAGPGEVLRAAERLRVAGFRFWDVFGPYPLPGMCAAMGLKRSPVGWFGFVGGVIGFIIAVAGIWYLNEVHYPLPIGGKPFFSPFSAFPTAYELAILFAAIATFGGLLVLTGLPRVRHPLFGHRRFALATRDRFFVVIESADPNYHRENTQRFLETIGAVRVEVVMM